MFPNIELHDFHMFHSQPFILYFVIALSLCTLIMGVAITIPILFWAHEILCMAILKHTRDVKKNGGAIEV